MAGLISCVNSSHKQTIANGGAAANNNLTTDQQKSWFSQTNTDSDVINGEPDAAFAASLQQNPYLQCGYDPNADGAKSLSSSSLASTTSTITGSNWTVNALSNLTVAISGAATNVDTIFTISNAQPAAAIAEAMSMAAQYSSNLVFTNVANVTAQNALARTSGTPSCGILMAQTLRLTAKDNSYYVNVAFDKPLPYLISPTLSKTRMNYELGKPIVVTNITATIDSNNPSLMQNGQTRTGTASVALISPTKTFTDSSGNNVTISADYAVRIATEFDGATAGALTWLNSVNEYFVNAGTGSIGGIVVQIPRKELGIVVYDTKK